MLEHMGCYTAHDHFAHATVTVYISACLHVFCLGLLAVLGALHDFGIGALSTEKKITIVVIIGRFYFWFDFVCALFFLSIMAAGANSLPFY